MKNIIEFGGYDWQILNNLNNSVLIITKDITERRNYHHEDIAMTWDKSDLRKYLNGEFYDKFTEAEKSRIITVTNKNSGNPFCEINGGQETQDNVFILSLEEFVRYFCDEISVQQLADKDYDGLCGIKYYPVQRKAKYGKKFSGLWLRSPGFYDYHAAYVNANGCIKAGGDRLNRIYGVRPVMWIRL